MLRRIVDFRRRPDAHWAAQLDCGHALVIAAAEGWGRGWVLTPEGRHAHIGSRVACEACRR